MTATGISGARTKKSAGRPLDQRTIELREAIVGQQDEHPRMSVRQIYYALMSRGLVPKDETRGYRPVQRQVLELRKAGLLPWAFIADGTRWQRKPETWGSAEDAARTLARTYRRDLWRTQDIRIEVWLEKDALASVVAPVTEAWDVSLMVSRGLSSAAFLQAAAEAASDAADYGATTMVFTLFDYDAGGARAKKMIVDYFDQYARCPVVVRDLAVTADQIVEWALPTRPAKKSDPQAKAWGPIAVELDAIRPDMLCNLVEDAITELIDATAWNMQLEYERSERELLARIAGEVQL